ncbi:sugar phosphate isomerase/epimerase [Fusobacterium sp.]|uniref:sugar phosphate isomerase/epimerase family protein n=1 Tax=Fusobacterium sp. TaxID=68766 RepID=UPI002633EC27|nr:sugar phosphate isomerase/epimerase [Fusobacterium sp.]
MNKVIHISDLALYKKDVNETIKFFKENKIENVELFIEPLDGEYTHKMLQVLDECTFKTLSFHGPYRKCNLAEMTDEAWENTLISYEKSFEMVKKYKPSFMVLHTNEWIPSGKITEDLKTEILKKVDKIVKLGKKYDIDVVVENVGIRRNMVYSQEEYTEIILKNNYKCLIDIGHAYANNWDLEKLLSSLKNNILGYHFHNNDGVNDQHQPISKGKINYLEIIELIKQNTPNTEIVLEYDYSIDLLEDLVKDWKKLQKLI